MRHRTEKFSQFWQLRLETFATFAVNVEKLHLVTSTTANLTQDATRSWQTCDLSDGSEWGFLVVDSD